MTRKASNQPSQDPKLKPSNSRLFARLDRWQAASAIGVLALLLAVSLSATVNGSGDTGAGPDNAGAPIVVASDSCHKVDKVVKPDHSIHSNVRDAISQAILEASSVQVALVDTEVLWMGRAGIGRNSTRYTSQATVIVVDDLDQPVAGARVAGTFTGNYLNKSQTVSGSTESDGSVTLELNKSVTKGMNDPAVTFTFCVDEVQASLPYNPADNVMTCDTAP